MIAKFNPTGTHVYKGKLKVRIDLYPEATDKTHALHYVEEAGGGKRLNPCLCHFIAIGTNFQLASLVDTIRQIFDVETLGQLDGLLSNLDKPGVPIELQRLMATKCGAGQIVSGEVDIPKLIDVVNERFALLEVRV